MVLRIGTVLVLFNIGVFYQCTLIQVNTSMACFLWTTNNKYELNLVLLVFLSIMNIIYFWQFIPDIFLSCGQYRWRLIIIWPRIPSAIYNIIEGCCFLYFCFLKSSRQRFLWSLFIASTRSIFYKQRQMGIELTKATWRLIKFLGNFIVLEILANTLFWLEQVLRTF